MTKKKKRFIGAAAGVLCLCVVLGAAGWVISRKNSKKASEEGYGLHYTVSTESSSSSIVNVTVDITPKESRTETELYFQVPEATVSKPKCTAEDGAEVPVKELGGAWTIGPVADPKKPLSLVYDIRLGESADADAGTVYGAFYDDLLVFQGSQVLAMPWVGTEEAEAIDKAVTELTFTLDTEYGWDSFMPFAKAGSKEYSFTKESPDWSVFNEVYHSAFCFGSFDMLKLEGQEENMIYVDQMLADTVDANDLEVVELFYSYFKRLFNGNDSGAPILLLRTDEEDNIILGGAGSGGAALSLHMKAASDCERMSRTLYHAFFDSMNHQRNLRYAPNLWLYDGLANFYTEDSAMELSGALQSHYGISMQDNLATRYGKYLYYTLSDRSVASASPDTEGQMSITQNDFYYQMKVPLVIAAIESFDESDAPSVLISYLIEHGDEKELDWKKFTGKVFGKNEKAVRQYLSGESFIPNYWGLNDSNLSENGVLPMVAQKEVNYATEYEQQGMNYPYPSFELVDYEKLDGEIEARGLSFGSEEVEQLVREYSESLYYWLMQTMLRAQVCEVEDPTTPEGKTALYDSKAEAAWEEYCKEHF